MNLASINWIAVILCVVANMVVGSVWYHPKTFYPAWVKAKGRPMKQSAGTNMAAIWILTAVAALVISIALAFVVKSIGAAMPGGVNLVNGALVGFMMWLGFIAPAYLINSLFAGPAYKAWAIEVGEYLVAFLIMGAILGHLH